MPTQFLRPFQNVLAPPVNVDVVNIDDGILPSLMERLEKLRRTIGIALAGLALVVVVCFSFSGPLVHVLLAPVRAALPEGARLIATTVPEIFLLHMNASLLIAIILVIPFWLYLLGDLLAAVIPEQQLLTFVPVAFLAVGLFALGAAFGHFFLFPVAVHFLTTFGSRRVYVMLTVSELFSLYTHFVLGIGAAFQVPTVVYVLSRFGLVTPRSLLRVWQAVILVAFTLAAIVTPTPDVITQSLLAIPLILLYFLSIGLCWLVQPSIAKEPPS